VFRETKLLATLEADREERRVGQERLRKEIETEREEMKAAMQSMRSELDEAIQHRTENIFHIFEHDKRILQSESTTRIDKTEEKLQTAEVSLFAVKTKPEMTPKQEAPVEDAVLKPVKGRKKRHRGQKQAAERCEEPNELTRGIFGSRRKLAAACRKVSRRATVARRRRDVFVIERAQNQDGYKKKCVADPGRMTRRAREPCNGSSSEVLWIPPRA
jgi:hypothetical protein